MPRLPAFLRSHGLLLALLAAQYAVTQLATSAEYGDASRNMHWGILVSETPRFLVDAPDPYAKTFGFAPDPPSLAPMGLFTTEPGPLHRWWGPVAPLLFALAWTLTRSYVALHLVTPLVGAAVVFFTYRLARGLVSRDAALVAAAFLACFPLFREHATIAYTEPISTLAMCAAVDAFLRGRKVATVLWGTLAAFCKMDMLMLYVGVVGITALHSAWTASDREARARRRRFLADVALAAVPVVLTTPWAVVHYFSPKVPAPPGGLSLAAFRSVAPDLLELLFYGPWFAAVIAIAVIGSVATVGVRARVVPSRAVAVMLAWLGLAIGILLVYAAKPGAGNSPRVILPALPAVAVLFAAGFERLEAKWRMRVGVYLGGMFLALGLSTIVYRANEAAETRGYKDVWARLRDRPRGFVLTERFWEAALYARQPTTWFEFDATFEHNVMHDPRVLARYLAVAPIRYVVLPAAGPLASTEARAWLDAHARREDVGAYALYDLHP